MNYGLRWPDGRLLRRAAGMEAIWTLASARFRSLCRVKFLTYRGQPVIKCIAFLVLHDLHTFTLRLGRISPDRNAVHPHGGTVRYINVMQMLENRRNSYYSLFLYDTLRKLFSSYNFLFDISQMILLFLLILDKILFVYSVCNIPFRQCVSWCRLRTHFFRSNRSERHTN